MSKLILAFMLMCLTPQISWGQLLIGHSSKRVNFREGPGLQYKVISTLNSSDALIILPKDTVNNYIEVFDVESNYHGFVYKNLIHVTDTLEKNKQSFFQKKDTKNKNGIHIELINKTEFDVFVWINGLTYNLDPREIKTLFFDKQDIKYFAASKGIFPVYGTESFMRGYTYSWEFKL